VLMQPENDRAAAQAVRQAMEEPSYLLEAPCTPPELMGVLGEAKICLAMRLHTLIFAARMAVPSLGLVYDPKVASYLQELGLPSAGDVCDFHREHAIAQADRLLANYGSVRAALEETAAALARAAGDNERLLRELLEKSGK